MNVHFDFDQVGILGNKLRNFPAHFAAALKLYDEDKTEELLRLVIKHASGRPGPNIVSGRYVASFRIVDKRVVNPSPQTHRLEYGFNGIDSLGRRYHQPPFPHFRPALEEMRKGYRRGIVPLVRNTWNASS